MISNLLWLPIAYAGSFCCVSALAKTNFTKLEGWQQLDQWPSDFTETKIIQSELSYRLRASEPGLVKQHASGVTNQWEVSKPSVELHLSLLTNLVESVISKVTLTLDDPADVSPSIWHTKFSVDGNGVSQPRLMLGYAFNGEVVFDIGSSNLPFYLPVGYGVVDGNNAWLQFLFTSKQPRSWKLSKLKVEYVRRNEVRNEEQKICWDDAAIQDPCKEEVSSMPPATTSPAPSSVTPAPVKPVTQATSIVTPPVASTPVLAPASNTSRPAFIPPQPAANVSKPGVLNIGTEAKKPVRAIKPDEEIDWILISACIGGGVVVITIVVALLCCCNRPKESATPPIGGVGASFVNTGAQRQKPNGGRFWRRRKQGQPEKDEPKKDEKTPFEKDRKSDKPPPLVPMKAKYQQEWEPFSRFSTPDFLDHAPTQKKAIKADLLAIPTMKPKPKPKPDNDVKAEGHYTFYGR